jgi:hypothetical protein
MEDTTEYIELEESKSILPQLFFVLLAKHQVKDDANADETYLGHLTSN